MLRRQLLRDVVLRAHVGNLRVAAVMARKTIAEGARRWNIETASPQSRLWSEYMVGTVMLSSFQKGEERIKMALRAPTNEEIYVEAMAVGEVRGKATMSDGSDSTAFDGGHMEVSKILYGSTTPYVTTIPATGTAEVDWQTFYDSSEQVPTVVRLGNALESDELRCCGLTIQKMPDSTATPTDHQYYELSDLRFDTAAFNAADLGDKDALLEYLNELIPRADLNEEKCRRIPLDYYCRCSKKGFGDRLAGLGSEQLHSLIHEDKSSKGIELTCHFCNEPYHFSQEDLHAIEPVGASSSKL